MQNVSSNLAVIFIWDQRSCTKKDLTEMQAENAYNWTAWCPENCSLRRCPGKPEHHDFSMEILSDSAEKNKSRWIYKLKHGTRQHPNSICIHPCAAYQSQNIWHKNTESKKHLYSGVLWGGDHEAEHRVEDDACDRASVAAEGVLLRRAWDPLFGISFLSHGAS